MDDYKEIDKANALYDEEILELAEPEISKASKHGFLKKIIGWGLPVATGLVLGGIDADFSRHDSAMEGYKARTALRLGPSEARAKDLGDYTTLMWDNAEPGTGELYYTVYIDRKDKAEPRRSMKVPGSILAYAGNRFPFLEDGGFYGIRAQSCIKLKNGKKSCGNASDDPLLVVDMIGGSDADCGRVYAGDETDPQIMEKCGFDEKMSYLSLDWKDRISRGDSFYRLIFEGMENGKTFILDVPISVLIYSGFNVPEMESCGTYAFSIKPCIKLQTGEEKCIDIEEPLLVANVLDESGKSCGGVLYPVHPKPESKPNGYADKDLYDWGWMGDLPPDIAKAGLPQSLEVAKAAAVKAQNGYISIRWDANTEDDLAKYTVYYWKANDEIALGIPIDDPKTVPSFVKKMEIPKDMIWSNPTGMEIGREWCIRVTASDYSGNQSGFSNKVCGIARMPGNVDIISVPSTILRVDQRDMAMFIKAYGSRPGDPNWDQVCDFAFLNYIGTVNYNLLKSNYGKKQPNDWGTTF